MKLVWLALAGAMGTLSRYGVSQLVNRFYSGSWPLATLSVNMIGSFLFGLIFAWCEQQLDVPTETRTIILVGFMGAFTTFSSFAFDNFVLITRSQWTLFIANILVQNIVGILCVLLGWRLASLMVGN